jgi:probable F420-dependent oxidoreductase
MPSASESHQSRPLRFGLTTAMPRGVEFGDFAVAVEQAGFDVLTFPDHVVPTLSPFTGATAAATATARLRTGTLVLNNDLRHPVEVARETATLAAVTGGRFELGLGAGHMKSEYDAVGIPFAPGGTRVSRLVESVEVIRALLGGEAVDFDGDHYQVHADTGALVAAPTEPVPLLIGGNGTRVLQLAGRVADIVGLVGFTHNRDATEVGLTHFDAAGLEERIAVVRDAAGGRFDAIELNALIQFVVHTDDREAAAAELAADFGGIPAQRLLDSPFMLIGTHEQMAGALLERRSRFGVSYWSVFDEWAGRPSALSDIAKVIALLR